MWSDITNNQSKLSEACVIQKAMGNYYNEVFSVEYIDTLIERKDMRVLFYEDNYYQLIIADDVKPNGSVRLLFAGIGNYTDLGIAATLFHAKVLEIIAGRAVAEVYAIWDLSNYEHANAYFSRCADSILGASNGLEITTNEQPNYKLTILKPL